MLLMGSSILLGCGGASTEVTEVAYVEEVVESSVGETIIEEEIIEEVPDLEVQPMETVMFGYVSEQKEIFSSDTISINTNLEKMCLPINNINLNIFFFIFMFSPLLNIFNSINFQQL